MELYVGSSGRTMAAPLVMHAIDCDLFAIDKARHRQTGEIVALKKLRMDRERDGEHKLLLHAAGKCSVLFPRLQYDHAIAELHRHASHFSSRA